MTLLKKMALTTVALFVGTNVYALTSSFDIKPEMTPPSAEGPLGVQDLPSATPPQGSGPNVVELGAKSEGGKAPSEGPSTPQGFSITEEAKPMGMPGEQQMAEKDFNPNEIKPNDAKPDEAGKTLSMGGESLPEELKPETLEKQMTENNSNRLQDQNGDLRKEFSENNVGKYPKELSSQEADKLSQELQAKNDAADRSEGLKQVQRETTLPEALKPENLDKQLTENGGPDHGTDLRKGYTATNVGGYPKELTPEEADKLQEKNGGGDSSRDISKIFG